MRGRWVAASLTLLAILAFTLSLFLANEIDTRRRPFDCPRGEACDVYFDDTHDRRTWERVAIVVAGAAVALGLRSLAVRHADRRAG